MRLETKIISTLLSCEEFARKVSPFILPEYFEVKVEKCVVEEYHHFFAKFNSLPDQDIIKIELSNRTDLKDEELSSAFDFVDSLDLSSTPEMEWMVQSTEKFCKDKAILNAIMDSIKIIDGEDKTRTVSALPSILQSALSVSFDTHIGHDYFDDAGLRYETYHNVDNKIPFKYDILNRITNGGMSNKTLNVILAGVHVGKSMFLCDYAAGAISMGYNVLYITLEMSEVEVAKRIDANKMNLPIREVTSLDLVSFNRRIEKIKEKTEGKLKIKEYPNGTANVEHFRALLAELKQKQGFVPDVVLVDYINICASARVKFGNGVNSYTMVKMISEELRAMAQQYDFPVLSATQLTRDGAKSSDVSMTDTSESWGLPQTVDWMLALMATDELTAMGQVLAKQLKNRYEDMSMLPRFLMGVDRPKQQFFDLEESAQEGIVQMPQLPEPEDKKFDGFLFN